MPIPLPNLDDRTYTDLVDEMRALIPSYAPGWTDHNESDPGIMLIEMFAWLTEALIYRTNRVTEASEYKFLKLLGAKNTPQLDLEEARAQAISNIRSRWRAITADDFEQLVLECKVDEFKIARAKCLPERDLTAADPDTVRPGHVSIIVFPLPEGHEDYVKNSIWKFLDRRRLINCRHHVVGPGYTKFHIVADVVIRPQFPPEFLKAQIKYQLKNFFDFLTGGPEKTGWPFGRDIYASEVYQLIEGTTGVDHVESVVIKNSDAQSNQKITVPPNNLIDFDGEASIINFRM